MAAYDGLTPVASSFWGTPVFKASNGELYCPGYTGDTYMKNQHDFVVIGDYTTPGIAWVSCVREREVDKKKIKGGDGARITLAGLEPASVDIKIKIWTPQQLLRLEELRALIFPGPQKKTTTVNGGSANSRTTVTPSGTVVTEKNGVISSTRGYSSTTIPTVGTTRKTVTKSVTVTQPYSCTHPTLKAHGVKSLVFIKFDGPDEGDVPGSRFYTFKAIEFALPTKGVNSTVTPTSAKAKGSLLDDNSGSLPGSNPRNVGP